MAPALALGGVAAALIAASAPVQVDSLTGAAVCSAAGMAVLLAVAAGAAKLLDRRADPTLAQPLIPRIAATAAWLLPLALALSVRSLWILPAAVVFVTLAAGLLRETRAAAGSEPAPSRIAPTLFALPEPTAEEAARSFSSKLAGLALYAALAFGIAGAVLPAAICAALACGLVAWFVPGSDRRRGSTVSSRVALALLLATIILTPLPDFGYPGPPPFGEPGADGKPAEQTGSGAVAPGGQFSGVVLLTRLEPEAPALKAPPPLRPRSNPLAASGPDTILFSGEYWYFYWPMQRPAADALQKLGDPKLLTYHSVDQSPLIMQARQALRRPIPTSCCGEIEVVVDVREEEPDSVSVELILLDSTQARAFRLSLGSRDLPPASPLPAKLRYRVPRPSRIQSFDEILVWFHLRAPRHGNSARVAIDRFNLVP